MGTDNPVPANHRRSPELLESEGSQGRRAPPEIILVSGGFDPLHVGHLRMLRAAQKYGRVYVALNSERWLRAKKSYVFMSWNDRAEILRELRCVYHVMKVDDRDGTVVDALEKLRPNYFANGGDRVSPEEREHAFCERAGIVELFGVGGGKVRSSSELVQSIAQCGTLGARDPDKNTLSDQLLRGR